MGEQDVASLCLVQEVNHPCKHGVLGPWNVCHSSASRWPFDLVWSGDDNRVQGTRRPPSFMEKLCSGRHRGDLDSGVIVLIFVMICSF